MWPHAGSRILVTWVTATTGAWFYNSLYYIIIISKSYFRLYETLKGLFCKSTLWFAFCPNCEAARDVQLHLVSGGHMVMFSSLARGRQRLTRDDLP